MKLRKGFGNWVANIMTIVCFKDIQKYKLNVWQKNLEQTLLQTLTNKRRDCFAPTNMSSDHKE